MFFPVAVHFAFACVSLSHLIEPHDCLSFSFDFAFPRISYFMLSLRVRPFVSLFSLRRLNFNPVSFAAHVYLPDSLRNWNRMCSVQIHEIAGRLYDGINSVFKQVVVAFMSFLQGF